MDVIEKIIGAIGKWQIFVCLVVFLVKIPVGFHQMGIIFLAPKPTFTCSLPNITIASDECSELCTSYNYDRSIFTETIITEWDLVCDDEPLANMAQTIFMLGILFGSVFFGTMSDKYGRRIPLVTAALVQFVFGITTSFATTFWLFCVLRFFTAIATGGTMVTSFVIIMEIVGTKWREVFSALYQLPFNFGHMGISAFAYFLRDWHDFQLAISIPSIIFISYYWLIPESPRWLFTVGRIKEATNVLEKAAKMNKLPTEKIHMDLEDSFQQRGGHENIAKGNIFDLFRTPNLRMKTIIMCFNWFACGLTFFGVAQYVGQADGDIFINVTISASLSIPALIVIYFLKVWGRKKTLIVANIMTGVVMIVIAFIPEDVNWAIVALASIGLFGVSISFQTVYLFGGELFPTVVRNVGVGLASVCARIGSMVAPFIVGLETYWLPPIIFGVMPILGAAAAFLLPETLDQPLPETLEDGELFGKKIAKKAAAVENGT